MSCLEFTLDAPCQNPSKKMPALDTQVWVGTQIREWSLPKCLIPDGVELPTKHGPLKQIILYQFYRKAIANRTPFNSRAAYPERDKISTISQEFIRRFKNTSRELPKSVLESVVKEFCQDLMRGGFTNKFISTCLQAAAKGYTNMLKLDITGQQPVNRPASFGAKARRAKNITAKSSWFKRAKKSESNQNQDKSQKNSFK